MYNSFAEIVKYECFLKEVLGMNTDKGDLLKLLQDKISTIDTLIGEVNWDSLRQWREETLMILDNLIEEDSKYYKNFEKISYHSSVISMGDREGNRRRDEEVYKRGLNNARSTLQAILYGVEKGLI